MQVLFQAIPAVDRLLNRIASLSEWQTLPRAFLKELINLFLVECRKKIVSGEISSVQQLTGPIFDKKLLDFIRDRARPNLRPVINGTGVVVHTNLGRSLLAQEAIRAVVMASNQYTNLEFSLRTGKRGSRYSLVEDLLCELTGAEAGLVVNNNAGAVLLVLDSLAKGKEVIVSRGELVEIGGSFRIPEVMAKSGAFLKEVGATNRTHLRDYELAIGPQTGALLKVHTSNYRIIGFHKEVSLKELVELGKSFALPVIEDLGSGNLYNFSPEVGLREPTVQRVLSSGVSVVSFSGDKLLGGPQAGIILGKKEYIEKIKKNPLNRALRIDKMTLAALEATLRLYKDPELAREKIPTLRAISIQANTLQSKARRLAQLLRRELSPDFQVSVKKDNSRVGGGASPELDLPTYLVQLRPVAGLSLEELRNLLLKTDPPVVGRIEGDAFCLDPRTLGKGDGPLLVSALQQAVALFGSNSSN